MKLEERRLVKVRDIWCVEHLWDGDPDPYILWLFEGEHILPTPFMGTVPAATVLAELRRLSEIPIEYDGL